MARIAARVRPRSHRRNASNNHRDNLRLVCPNCDSQLPTFKARNRGQGRAWRKQRYADGKSY
ncbi:hypothetical protein Back2_13130 [Nocardioides baekrokdamisoli]|uniref:Uncharacterized protein n=1 Tax=Nocardioides baekrokdamisoli TaxID=1804624 RepID=A0A3G9IF57_9ACTN|nr:hypothetical protein Back2_13130 [Nocardioides baekrokdamisoli]